MSHQSFKTSSVVQWLRHNASAAEGVGFLPGLGTKIAHATWCGQTQNEKKKTPFFKKNQSLFQWQNFYSSQSLWNCHLVNKYLLTSTMHHIHSTSESPQWMWGDKTRNQSLALGSFPYGLTETFPLPLPFFCIFSLSWKSDVHSHRLNLITDFLYSKIITTSS